MVEVDSYVFNRKYGIGQVKQIEDKTICVLFVRGEYQFNYPYSIGKSLYEVYEGKYVIDGNKLIRYIGKDKFITIPDVITIIGHRAFENTEIETISFGNHVTNVEGKAFFRCKKLLSVSDTNNLIKIGSNAFSECLFLQEINLSDSLLFIEEEAFAKCVALSSVIIPSKISCLNYGLFQNCINLKTVITNGPIKAIDSDVFYDCYNLEVVDFGYNLRKIGKNAFKSCSSLKSIYLPKTTRSIHKEAFDKDIDIIGFPNSYAEQYAMKTQHVFIPDTERKIDDRVKPFDIRGFVDQFRIKNNSSVEGLLNKDIISEDDNNDLLENTEVNNKYSLSNMTAIEKVFFSILVVLALFLSRDNLSNIFEKFLYGYVSTSQGRYIGDINLGVMDGEGVMEYNNGRIYNGQWNNGIPDGQGELIFDDGSTFIGVFSDGVFKEGEYIKTFDQTQVKYKIVDSSIASYSYELEDGTSINRNYLNNAGFEIKYSNGDRYTGNIIAGQRTGTGEYVWKDGTKYSGNWVNDLINGNGVLTYSSGVELNGSFENNELTSGKIVYKDDKYIISAMVTDRLINGEYRINNNLGESYYGTRYSSYTRGNGTIVYYNKDTYDGDIVAGKKEGYGTYIWSTGQKYTGYWKNDLMNGNGTYYYSDIERIEGYFVNGKPSGTCYYYDKSGTAYVSYWSNGEQTSIYKR